MYNTSFGCHVVGTFHCSFHCSIVAKQPLDFVHENVMGTLKCPHNYVKYVEFIMMLVRLDLNLIVSLFHHKCEVSETVSTTTLIVSHSYGDVPVPITLRLLTHNVQGWPYPPRTFFYRDNRSSRVSSLFSAVLGRHSCTKSMGMC